MTEERVYGRRPEEVFELLKSICGQPPFRIKRIDESVKRIQVSTALSWVSWGETLEVLVHPHSRGALVHIEGGARVPLNIAADPERHIREILGRLDKELEAE